MHITELSSQYFREQGLQAADATTAYRKAIRLFSTNTKYEEIEVYFGHEVFRIASDICSDPMNKTASLYIFNLNGTVIGLQYKGGENMSTEKTLEEKQADLEKMVRDQQISENLSEVAMPGVSRVIENNQPKNDTK